MASTASSISPAADLAIEGLLTDEQTVQCKANLQFQVICINGEARLGTYPDLFKLLAPYAFEIRSSPRHHQTVGTGYFPVDQNGQVTIMVSRHTPRGTAEVASIAEMLEYCNLTPEHDEGAKLMWLEALNCTVYDLMTGILVRI